MDERDFRSRAKAVVLRISSSSWDNVIARCDELIDEIREGFVGDLVILKEIEIRVCEMKISFLPANTPKEVFDAVWREMLVLGFSDLDTKGVMAFYRANYLCKFSAGGDEDFEVAMRMIEDVVSGLEGGDVGVQEYHRGVLMRLREKRNRKF